MRVPVKKRFGISVPAEVANKLEELAETAARDRSSVVVKALEEYLHEEVHGEREHSCSGVLILLGTSKVSDVDLGDLWTIVKASCSVKLGPSTVTVVFVEGSYAKIKQLRKLLVGKYEMTRYIPLYCLYKRSSS